MQAKPTDSKEQFWRVISLTWIVHWALLALILITPAIDMGSPKRGISLIRSALFHWDANNFLNIARNGYEIDWQICFFPLYPFLITLLTLLFRNDIYVALLIPFICHLFASVYLYRLTLLDFSADFAERVLLFSLIFPTAFYAVVPYSESLFLMLVVMSYFYYRRECFFWAGILAFFAVLTRPTGIAALALLWGEYLFETRKTPAAKKALFPLVFPLFGIALIFLVNYLYRGDILHFMHTWDRGWGKHLALPQVGLLHAWDGFLNRRPPISLTNGLFEIIGFVLIWMTAIYGAFRLRKAYACYCLASMVLTTFVSILQSTLRYAFVVFPLYFLLAKFSKNETFKWVIIAFSLVFLGLLAHLYGRGDWVQ